MRRAALAALLLVLGSCSGEHADDNTPAVELAWEGVELPVPPGPPGRLAVRDAVRCDGWWYVVGGVFHAPGESRPAAWRSRDGRSWTSLTMRAEWYWAKRNVIASVACHDGDVAMVGAKSGGAHGNPRVSTWRRAADGAYVDVKAPFEQYGGPEAVNVGVITGGPPGFLIVGNRYSGAAVWLSPDGREFDLVDDDPALGKAEEFDALGTGAAWADGEWTLLGNAQRTDRVPRIPLAWTSADGRAWRLQEVPFGEEYADLQRGVDTEAGLLAVGLRGDGFGVWERTGEEWTTGAAFGDFEDETTGSAFVSSASASDSGDLVLVAGSDRVAYRLWASTDQGAQWSEVPVPLHPASAGEQTLVARVGDGQVMLLADDAEQGRVWLADLTP